MYMYDLYVTTIMYYVLLCHISYIDIDTDCIYDIMYIYIWIISRRNAALNQGILHIGSTNPAARFWNWPPDDNMQLPKIQLKKFPLEHSNVSIKLGIIYILDGICLIMSMIFNDKHSMNQSHVPWKISG